MINTRSDFRTVERGDIAFETNSRAQTSSRFVDRNRLKTRYTEEYVPATTPGKPGKWVAKTVTASIEDAARQGCDAMGHVSSYRDGDAEARNEGGCCSIYNESGPLTKRRGDSA